MRPVKEVWLKTNRRALSFALVLPSLLVAIGLAWAAMADSLLMRIAAAAILGVGLIAVAGLLLLMRQPRLARSREHLLVYLGMIPFRIPIDVVEAFLLGQGPTMLPGRRNAAAQTKTVVIRLADSATDWSRREVNPSIGKWCEGYITLRGTWCEPLNVEVVRRLNRNLSDAHAQLRSQR